MITYAEELAKYRKTRNVALFPFLGSVPVVGFLSFVAAHSPFAIATSVADMVVVVIWISAAVYFSLKLAFWPCHAAETGSMGCDTCQEDADAVDWKGMQMPSHVSPRGEWGRS